MIFDLECAICKLIKDEYGPVLASENIPDAGMSDSVANAIIQLLIDQRIIRDWDHADSIRPPYPTEIPK